MRRSTAHDILLGIVPGTQGFGFAVLEQRGRLVSWGCAASSSMSDSTFLQRIEHLVDKFGVRVIVLEDPISFKRLERARRRTAAVASYATTRAIGVCMLSRETVRKPFGVRHRLPISSWPANARMSSRILRNSFRSRSEFGIPSATGT